MTRRLSAPRIVILSGQGIFVICGEGLTLSPYVPRTSPFFSSVFHTACALSAPTGHLPLEGKADDTREICDQETFGHRPINIRGASNFYAPYHPPLNPLTLLSLFRKQSRDSTLKELTLNPEP